MKYFFILLTLNTDFRWKVETNWVELKETFSANIFFKLMASVLRSREAAVTTVSPLQVFQIINSTRWVYTFGQSAVCVKDVWWMDVGVTGLWFVEHGTKSYTVMSEERHIWTATLSETVCSYNAMVLPSETRDNASKQIYWRLKRLGLESTPSNNNNYNNNYMFIYTIYRLKNAML